jgi:DNA helicase-4
LAHAIDIIVSEYGEDSEIMLLGRNNADINIVESHPAFSKKFDKDEEVLKVEYRKYPKLKLFFLTAHRSKGLEGENVILLNGRNSLTGFPNKISYDPVLWY